MTSLVVCEQVLRRNRIGVEHIPPGLLFKFQGGGFIIVENDEDPNFLQIAMPNIYEAKSAADRIACLEAANKVNYKIKVGKAMIHQDGEVWLMSEVLLDYTTPQFEDIFFRLLQILIGMRTAFKEAMV